MTSRRLSEVDPFDTTSYRTQSHDQFDVAGGTQLAEQLNEPSRSRTDTIRSRSGTLKSSIFGRKNSSNDAVDIDRKYTIQEEPEEADERDKSDEPSAEAETEPKIEAEKKNHATLKKVALMFTKVYVIIFALFIGILSIYWGSLYNRSSHYHKIKYLVVLENNQTMPSLFSLTLEEMLQSKSMRKLGTWDIKTYDTFSTIAEGHNNTIREEVIRQIHHQNYWGGILVPGNLTTEYYTALKESSDFNASIEFVYETGRNPQAVPIYILGTIQAVEKKFVSLASESIVQRLVNQLSSDEKTNLVSTNPELLSSLWWNYYDNRPIFGAIVLAVIEIGLIYMLVLSFHQFNFAAATHQMIATKIHTKEYLIYHITVSQLAYFVLSLVYSLMTLAFQIPIDVTFGKSGFLVEWAFVFLTMSALGGVNENVAMQIFARYRPVIGFWIVFFLCTNVSVVFSPMVVMSDFYRYGYAMPMYQGYELLKVVFCNTYKGNMGRNIGILIAWILLMNCILPFNLRNVRNHVRKIEKRAKEALEKSKDTKSS